MNLKGKLYANYEILHVFNFGQRLTVKAKIRVFPYFAYDQ